MTTGNDHLIRAALNVAAEWGDIDGAHHKQWVIDQMVRALCGARRDTSGCYGEDGTYQAWVGSVENTDAPDSDDWYSWDEGIAP